MMAAMRKDLKPSPTESPLLFEIDPEPIEETLTALGGIPLVVQAFRSLGLPPSVREQVRVKEWHREKAGTVELVHDVIKNELGGGVLPSKYFGANAAWLRLAVISHNALTALKRLALPAELLTARPKRLRFLIFNTPGRLVHHARRLVLRLAALAEWIAAYRQGLRLLPLPS